MKLLFISLGCDKNLVDSEVMLGMLARKGYTFTDDEAEAEIVVVNTCCFINDAKEESIQTILDMAELKKTGQVKALVVAGCLAQRYQKEIQEEIEEVDAIIGTASIDKIVETVEGVLAGTACNYIEPLGRGLVGRGNTADSGMAVGSDNFADSGTLVSSANSADGGIPAGSRNSADSETPAGSGNAADSGPSADSGNSVGSRSRVTVTGGHYAYLKIAEGCDKHCTYCIIPKVRGPYRSVPMEELVEEAGRLAEGGVKELILVAQETTLYGVDLYGEKKLPELLHRLCRLPQLVWIRILYCYPEEITEELIQAIKEEEKICHYLDIPIQHGSDAVLKRMGRKTDSREIRGMVERLRREIPDICLRTTLITGFPGETQEDHEALMDFVDEMEFDRLGVFTYSQEEDTPAAEMAGQIEEGVKESRRDEIMGLQQEIAYEMAEDMVGRELYAMIEGKVADGEAYVARTYKDAPNVDGYLFINTERTLMSGDFVKVRITGSYEYDLIGEICDEFTK